MVKITVDDSKDRIDIEYPTNHTVLFFSTTTILVDYHNRNILFTKRGKPTLTIEIDKIADDLGVYIFDGTEDAQTIKTKLINIGLLNG